MIVDLKHRVIGAGLGLVAATRADWWLRPLARGQGAILTFHNVRPQRPDPFRPNALLEITPEHLDLTLALVRRLGFAIVPLDDIPDRLARGGGEPFVALTFDDGYRNNRDYAMPILKRHGAPWTLFVTTDYAAGKGRLWWIELEKALRVLDRLTLDGIEIPARDAAEKTVAFATAYRLLRAGPERRLRDVIGRWCDQAGIDRDLLVTSLCLGWDELRELSRDPDVTIGAHTVTHPMLAKGDEADARREISESRRILEARLGLPVRHLSYPVGDATSAGPSGFQLAAEAGFTTAVTTRPGHLFAGHAKHLTALPRVSVNGLHQSEPAMRALLSGVPFLVWNRGRRLNVD